MIIDNRMYDPVNSFLRCYMARKGFIFITAGERSVACGSAGTLNYCLKSRTKRLLIKFCLSGRGWWGVLLPQADDLQL